VATKTARLAIFGDPHVPYHSEANLAWLRKEVGGFKPTHLICTGDVMEASPPSVHPHESTMTAEEEFLAAERYLSALAEVTTHAKLVWCLGNHDHRYFEDDPRRVPKAYRSLCDWNRIAPGLRAWQQVPYGHGPDCCYQVGQVVVRHGVKTGTGARKEDWEFNHMVGGHGHRLHVSGHLHKPEPPHELLIGSQVSGVPSGIYRANTGTMADVDKLTYACKCRTFDWGPAVLLVECRVGRHTWPGKEWDAEMRRPQ
jgi:hypothetical protein